MDAMIYAADVYCVACGTVHRERITAAGEAPATPDDERSYDSDAYPKGPFPDAGGESDCPQHCADCGVFLDNPLTSDGVEYTLDHLDGFKPGEGNAEVLDVWATAMDAYSLSKPDQQRLDEYRAVRESGRVLTPAELRAAREWIGECEWLDLDEDAIAELRAAAIEAGIAKHFDGGIEGFRATF